MRRLFLVLALLGLLVVGGCGDSSTSSASSSDSTGASPTASPSVTQPPKSAETDTCVERVKPWLDEVEVLNSEVNGDGVNALTLQDHVTSLGAAYQDFQGVCSAQLRQAAADANYRFASANLSLRVCVVNASKCEEYQAKAQRQMLRGLSDYPKVNDLIYP